VGNTTIVVTGNYIVETLNWRAITAAPNRSSVFSSSSINIL